MAKQVIKVGFTDYTTLVFIPDPASTDGSGKTGLLAANLTVSGVRVETDNDVTVTDYTASLNDLAALTTVHTDWGLKEVSSTLAPGLYRLDIADAIFASGAWSAVVYVMITTSAAAASPMEFTLVAYDINDTVRMGLTALPNAAADAAGGLIISDAGGLDADAQRADVTTILADTNDIQTRLPAALVSGRMDASVGAMATNVMTAAATAADFTTEVTTGLAQEATLVTIASYIDTEVAAIKAKTDNLPASPAAVGSAMTLTAGAVDAIHDEVVEGTTTFREITRGSAAVLLGKASGLETTTAIYRDIGDTKDRITATVDADGNRTAVVRDLS